MTTIPIMPEDDFNKGFDLDEMIDNLPAGLERAIRRILEFHIGRVNAISRTQLVFDLASMGFDYIGKDDRPIRECINLIRKSGTPGSWICSTGGVGGGYWLGANKQEVYEFTHNEYKPRAMDMLETAKAMEHAADLQFGEGTQESFL